MEPSVCDQGYACRRTLALADRSSPKSAGQAAATSPGSYCSGNSGEDARVALAADNLVPGRWRGTAPNPEP
jgi:hypothetical protein